MTEVLLTILSGTERHTVVSMSLRVQTFVPQVSWNEDGTRELKRFDGSHIREIDPSEKGPSGSGIPPQGAESIGQSREGEKTNRGQELTNCEKPTFTIYWS